MNKHTQPFATFHLSNTVYFSISGHMRTTIISGMFSIQRVKTRSFSSLSRISTHSKLSIHSKLIPFLPPFHISFRFYPTFFNLFKPGHASRILPFLTNKPSTSIIAWPLLHRSRIYNRIISEHKALNPLNSNKPFFIAPNGIVTSSLPNVMSLLKSMFPTPNKHLLGPSYPEKNLVSGLKSYIEVEKYLKEDSLIGQEYRQTIAILFMKVVYSFVKEKPESLKQVLEKGFNTVFGSLNNLQMSFELKKIMGDKIISFLQHLLVIFWNNKDISYDTLKSLYNNKIDCRSFSEGKIKILTVSELFVVEKYIIQIRNHSNFIGEYQLINPDGFSKMLTYFCEISSMEQAGQKHADVCIIKCNFNGEEIFTWYVDIKSYVTIGFNYRRVSLFHPDDYTTTKLSNDVITSLKRYLKQNNISDTDPIYQLYYELVEIKTTFKNPVERFNGMLKKLCSIMFDENFKKLNISFVIDAGHDVSFDYQLETVYNPRFEALKNDPEFQNRFKEFIALFPKKTYDK